MKKTQKIVAALLVFLLMASGCAGKAQSPSQAAGEGKLSVYASVYPIFDFASKIAGDRAQVSCMLSPGEEAHHWEPQPADIVALENADVFIYNGAGLEHWVESVLATLKNQSLMVVEAAEGMDTEAHEDEDGHDGHVHSHGGQDPHVWLSPMNAKQQMEAIQLALSAADPENAAYYRANYEHYAQELDKLDSEFADTLGPLPNREIIVSHQAFGYLCERYGLTQIAVEGLTPDSEPDAARLAQIIGLAKAHQIRVIFFEQLASPKVAEMIAREVGAQTAVLSPIEALSDAEIAAGEDYFSVMRKNLAALYEALK